MAADRVDRMDNTETPTSFDTTVRNSRVFAATRLYRKNTSADAGPLLNKLRRWIECAATCDGLLVAYPLADEFLGKMITQILESKKERLLPNVVVQAVGVVDWVGFTPALNALVTRAMANEATHILFSSLEMIFNAAAVDLLLNNIYDTDLVVGPELKGYHSFFPPKNKNSTSLASLDVEPMPISACNIPWNTMALWDLEKLSIFGFPPIADGWVDGVEAGMEEVAAIAVCQMALGAAEARANLIRVVDQDVDNCSFFGTETLDDGSSTTDGNDGEKIICVWDVNGNAWLDLLGSGDWGCPSQRLSDEDEEEMCPHPELFQLAQQIEDEARGKESETKTSVGKKVATKNARAASQMRKLPGLSKGTVRHVVVCGGV